jgi:2-methylcitrate dehydratase PrpD
MDIDRDVDQRARALLVDYLAVCRRGRSSGPGMAATKVVVEPGPCVVEGTPLRTTAQTAALVNGIAAHAIELDDTYEPASAHPGVAVWPAVLAVGDEQGAPLRTLLTAGIHGYDAIAAIGERLDPDEAYARGFHPTGILGPIGAAVAVGHLLGLDEAGRRNAVGIAASAASGLLEFLADGAWTKPFHAGQAASSGIVAARLAAAGFVGPAAAIDGRRGFLHAFGRGAEATADTPSFGHGVLATAMKSYPCCRYTHGCIELLIDLELDPGDIAAVGCGVLSAGQRLVADPIEAKRRIAGPVDAQFSMPFTAALALSRRAVTLEHFADAPALGEELGPLMARIDCHTSPDLEAAFPGRWGAEVVVQRHDGSVERRVVADMPGAPARPFSPAQLLEKATALVGDETAAALVAACAADRDAEPLQR